MCGRPPRTYRSSVPTTIAAARGGRAREVGSATLEYVAGIALAGVLIMAVVLPMQPVPPPVKAKICAVLTALGVSGSCGGGSSSTPSGPTGPTFDPKPAKCKLGEHGDKVTSEVTIGFFKFGSNAGFVETHFSDGTVTYTATDGSSLGAVVSAPGGELKVGGLEVGEKVDFGADFKVDAGSTWTFANEDEAKAMRKQLDDYLDQQYAMRHVEGYWAVMLFQGEKKPPKLPNQTVSTIDVGGSAEYKVGVNLPWKQDPDATSSIPALNLGEFGAKIGGNDKWTQMTDNTTGAKTYTTSAEGYGQVSGTVGPVAGELKGLLGSSVAVTRDKDNQLTKITMVDTRDTKATLTTGAGQKDLGGKVSDANGSSDVTVTTTQLEVKTPEQRALAEAWLTEQANDPNAYISPETSHPDKLMPGDPFQNLMYSQATVSDVSYDNVTDKTGFAAKVKFGVSVGVDFSLETNDSKATSATYLGAPGSGATTRPAVDFPECVSR